MFEEAVRGEGNARWHLGTCGWTTYLRQEKRATSEIDPRMVCLTCARAARQKLRDDEASQPHGMVIVRAADRHMAPR
ncbi:MAG TPA: hypothetical protein VJP45_07690 [Candidatus Limnocylindria bacterium]|nr:hypothetical protein [Candidatus Limnocylindria bacterium]